MDYYNFHYNLNNLTLTHKLTYKLTLTHKLTHEFTLES